MPGSKKQKTNAKSSTSQCLTQFLESMDVRQDLSQFLQSRWRNVKANTNYIGGAVAGLAVSLLPTAEADDYDKINLITPNGKTHYQIKPYNHMTMHVRQKYAEGVCGLLNNATTLAKEYDVIGTWTHLAKLKVGTGEPRGNESICLMEDLNADAEQDYKYDNELGDYYLYAMSAVVGLILIGMGACLLYVWIGRRCYTPQPINLNAQVNAGNVNLDVEAQPEERESLLADQESPEKEAEKPLTRQERYDALSKEIKATFAIEEGHKFLCPITHEIIEQPRVAQDGFTYERGAIENWLLNHDASPITREQITLKIVYVNKNLDNEINEKLQELERQDAEFKKVMQSQDLSVKAAEEELSYSPRSTRGR